MEESFPPGMNRPPGGEYPAVLRRGAPESFLPGMLERDAGPRGPSAGSGQHPVLGERAAFALVVEFEQPVVVVDPRDLVVRLVGPVRARPDRDRLVAIDGERPQVGAKRPRLVAGARVSARVQPGLDDRVAPDLGVVGGMPPILGVGTEERRDVGFVVALPCSGIGVEPLLNVLVGEFTHRSLLLGRAWRLRRQGAREPGRARGQRANRTGVGWPFDL